MWSVRLARLGLIGALFLGGTAASGCGTQMLDTHTVHNREATRIWIVRRRGGSNRDEVLYCDAAMLRATNQLCQRWE